MFHHTYYKMQQITIGQKLSNAKIKVGMGLETKINLIIGANEEDQLEKERIKIREAASLGIHTIIDLSTKRFKVPLWQYGKENFPQIAFGRVAPILVSRENSEDVSPKNLLKEYERSAKEGIDYMTLNLIPIQLQDIQKSGIRNTPTTSRQGGIMIKYMMKNKSDNPHNEILNDILDIFKEYYMTIHIGSTYRPKGITESYDSAHTFEISEQMKLFRYIDEYGVQTIVEPMSHQPLHQIGPGIQRLRKEYGEYVPFQMLGPITTEDNYDLDHIAAAPGAAIAAMNNVGKITTIPPNEHKSFPTIEDTIMGIKTTLTAVHAGDLTRLEYLKKIDYEITKKRDYSKTCDKDSNDTGCNKCKDLCPLLINRAYI